MVIDQIEFHGMDADFYVLILKNQPICVIFSDMIHTDDGCESLIQPSMTTNMLLQQTEIHPSRRGEQFKAPC